MTHFITFELPRYDSIVFPKWINHNTLHRNFLIHLVNMNIYCMPFRFIKTINDKVVDLIKYRVKIVKHIFNYNSINRVGLMNKQLKLAVLDEYICD